MVVRVTQTIQKTLHSVNAGRRVTSVMAKVINTPVVGFTKVTHSVAKVINQPLKRMVNVTMASAKTLARYTPNFEWIIMFIDDANFPHNISYNSQGTTALLTDSITVDSGFDQHNSRWEQPLMEFNVSYGVRTMEQLHSLLQHFRAMRGKTFGFRYRDWVDYTSNFAMLEEARAAPETSMLDQLLGVGDGQTTVFQLKKRYYAAPGSTTYHDRIITKPVAGTVTVAVNGVEAWPGWATVDTSTGKVSFGLRHALDAVGGISITSLGGQNYRISKAGQDFSGFMVGERIVITGHPTAGNNNKPMVITANGVAGQMDVTVEGTGVFLTAITTAIAINIRSIPAPKTGYNVTAGYHFDVPVRYDVARLSQTLEHYGIGSANEVRLREIRIHEE